MNTYTRRPTMPAAPAPNWANAACLNEDPDLFFPAGTLATAHIQIEKARQVCRRCPLTTQCLTWALDVGEHAGVWGGLCEEERRKLLRRRGQRHVSYERCIDEQEYIEERIAEGATPQEIARELGVDRSAVVRAVKFFEKERQTLAAGRGVAV
ncbi:WhiB family transcriptional regulator [Streptomyces sp. AD55]|uniref:WhiB family transcriptional regulator n=1 Tax=Streptomyces sp. AD55 TaxID=3242895 RepID=UPI0035278964